MRYEDWDVLLFPRDCEVPFKEFKVACHVVYDEEFSRSNGSFGLPTVCCFIPSLPEAAPFQVSIHSWSTPVISQFTRLYSKYTDNAIFEARVFIDGRLVASTSIDRENVQPHVVAHSFEFSKTGDLEPLKFPNFRQELLQQNFWRAADELGRIRILISEGFPRDSLSMPIERVRNIVAFSFQHAPLEILEASSIAWPNPSMWGPSPFTASMSVPTYHSDGVESHAHSPRRRSYNVSGSSKISVGGSQKSLSKSQVPQAQRQPSYQSTTGSSITRSTSSFNSVGDANVYLEWLNGMSVCMDDTYPYNGQEALTLSPSIDDHSHDINMGDNGPAGYGSTEQISNVNPDMGLFNFLHNDDDYFDYVKFPISLQPGSGIKDGDTQNLFIPPTISKAVIADLNVPLNDSLLNQPLPPHVLAQNASISLLNATKLQDRRLKKPEVCSPSTNSSISTTTCNSKNNFRSESRSKRKAACMNMLGVTARPQAPSPQSQLRPEISQQRTSNGDLATNITAGSAKLTVEGSHIEDLLLRNSVNVQFDLEKVPAGIINECDETGRTSS